MRLGVYQEGHASLRLIQTAAVPENMRADVLEVVGLETETEAQGKGHAKALLSRLGAIADDHKKVLLLIPTPFADKPMSAARLIAWYVRMGYQQIQEKPCLMARPPKRHG